MLGTAITFAMQCILQRTSLSYWGGLLVPAVQTGFCGALTTVSTFVTEVGGTPRWRSDVPAALSPG